MKCEICKKKLKKVAVFKKPFSNEKIFQLRSLFEKSIYKCFNCYHHKIDSFNYRNVSKIYTDIYGKLAHGNYKKKFNKINNMKKKKSSNYYRKKYIISNFKLKKNDKLLDFGTGIGIFPYTLNKITNTFFYEIDKNSINFCKNYLKLKYINILKLNPKKFKFNYITCNKVLEHMNITDVKKYLKIFKKLLHKKGKIYVELPASAASKDGYSRQEFYSEHINVFSVKSAKIFFRNCGFKIIKFNSLREVNNKYTLRIILGSN